MCQTNIYINNYKVCLCEGKILTISVCKFRILIFFLSCVHISFLGICEHIELYTCLGLFNYAYVIGRNDFYMFIKNIIYVLAL